MSSLRSIRGMTLRSTVGPIRGDSPRMDPPIVSIVVTFFFVFILFGRAIYDYGSRNFEFRDTFAKRDREIYERL